MQHRLTWFALGALFASLIWGIILITLNEQLLQTLLGFGGQQ
jgi:hypothetical protein